MNAGTGATGTVVRDDRSTGQKIKDAVMGNKDGSVGGSGQSSQATGPVAGLGKAGE